MWIQTLLQEYGFCIFEYFPSLFKYLLPAFQVYAYGIWHVGNDIYGIWLLSINDTRMWFSHLFVLQRSVLPMLWLSAHPLITIPASVAQPSIGKTSHISFTNSNFNDIKIMLLSPICFQNLIIRIASNSIHRPFVAQRMR